MPAEFYGDVKSGSEYVKSQPRVWTDGEVEWILDAVSNGSSVAEIADAIGRTEISVQVKLKRLSKSDDSYNDKHRQVKYLANQMFLDVVQPKSVLDVFAGNSYYLGKVSSVTTNDKDEKFDTDYHLDALRLLCQLYVDGSKFDVIDLDPYGSSYDCFDLSIKMARKGMVVSFGEWGHKRWKRCDFVRPRYNIDDLSKFVPDAFIAEFQRIAAANHKNAIVFDVLQYGNFLRVYFKFEPLKIVEQWS